MNTSVPPFNDAAATTSNKPEMLIAAVLHLMTHYSSHSLLNNEQGVCLKLATVIERHLSILSDLPDLGPILRATCGQMSEQWTLVVEHAMQQQTKAKISTPWRNNTRLSQSTLIT